MYDIYESHSCLQAACVTYDLKRAGTLELELNIGVDIFDITVMFENTAIFTSKSKLMIPEIHS